MAQATQPFKQSAYNRITLKCPECGNYSDSIKAYHMPTFMLFIGIWVFARRRQYICCPRCMRKHIGKNLFTYNILTGNLFWLLFGLPWGITELIMSTTRGHSRKVLTILEENANQKNEVGLRRQGSPSGNMN